jgi:predicted alpha/beta hydrolase
MEVTLTATLFGSGGRALLAAPYPDAPWETRKLAPRELGVKSIGHFGFFRERFRDSLWRETADWLERQ